MLVFSKASELFITMALLSLSVFGKIQLKWKSDRCCTGAATYVKSYFQPNNVKLNLKRSSPTKLCLTSSGMFNTSGPGCSNCG